MKNLFEEELEMVDVCCLVESVCRILKKKLNFLVRLQFFLEPKPTLKEQIWRFREPKLV